MIQANPSPSEQLMQLLAYLQRDPENDKLRIDIFERALAMGAFDEAGLQMGYARRTRPDDPEWKHREALLYMACGQFAEARDLLTALVDEGQEAPGTLYNLAYAHFGTGSFTQAVNLVSPLRESTPEVASLAWSLWLRCQHHLHQLDEGLHAFTEALPLGPLSADAFGVASLMAIDATRVPDAEKWSDHALREDPTQQEALITRGSLALGNQQPQLAQRCFEQSLLRNEKDGRSWSGMAFTKLLLMDFKAALDSFQKAVTYMPDHIGTWIGLGWCLFLAQDPQGAKAAFEQALALDHNFSESHGGLAVALAHLGEREAAEREVAISLKLDSKSLSVRYAQSLLSGEASNAEAFQRMVHRVLSQHPGLKDGQTLADVVFKRKK